MEAGRGVEAEVDHGLVSALAGSGVVDLHLARRLAEELEIDLVVRRAVEAGSGIGEEAGDDAGRGDRLEAGLEAPVAEEAARLVFARGEAAAGEYPSRRFRSEEHTSELQSLMRNSYAVFCLKKKKKTKK